MFKLSILVRGNYFNVLFILVSKHQYHRRFLLYIIQKPQNPILQFYVGGFLKFIDVFWAEMRTQQRNKLYIIVIDNTVIF